VATARSRLLDPRQDGLDPGKTRPMDPRPSSLVEARRL
jgi:hypothetical protein